MLKMLNTPFKEEIQTYLIIDFKRRPFNRSFGSEGEYMYVYVPGKLSVHGKKNIIDVLKYEKVMESLEKEYKPKGVH